MPSQNLVNQYFDRSASSDLFSPRQISAQSIFALVKLTSLVFLIFACSTFLPIQSQLSAVDLKIKIASPKNKSEVGSVDVFSGTISEQGQPFILVRPKMKSGKGQKNPWWVQKNVLLDTEGRFVGQVHFGNKLSDNGMEFEAVAILVNEKSFAQKLQTNYSIDEIPRKVTRSRTLQLKLNKTKKISAPIGFVTYPKENDFVGSKESLTGIIPKYGTPVVLVRAVEGDGIWWVQSIISADATGRFKSDLYFGNENTPNKCRFQIAVVVLEAKDASALKKGSTLKKLPRDHLGLQTITVELQKETIRNATQNQIQNR